ncbi:hypothetical protein [Tropicimonas marinistellae]|uniref:hypothetical protein n=1 Tax=Tropicimonas marinistellae TaxID=1739787 RepID=UPI00082A0983|nr:hypothetical protein [Tropicimonas marinistellae]
MKIQRKDIIRAQRANADAVQFANNIVQMFRVMMEHTYDEGRHTVNPAWRMPLLKTPDAKKQVHEPWPN